MNAAVRIDADGRVLVHTGKVELGQGLHTALAQIVADELGVDIGLVDFAAVDTAHSPDQGVTSGSLSVQEAGRALREACATLRAADAPAAPRFVGRSTPRRDLERKFAGLPAFIHDLEPARLAHGRVVHPPRADARLLACDEAAVRACEGVLQVLRDGSLLGLIADTPAHADAAAGVLRGGASWQADADRDETAADLRALPALTRTVAERGEPSDAAATVRSFGADYAKPWLAHASIAPSCALAVWRDGDLRVWSHSQGIFNLRRDLALAFGVDLDRVRVSHVEGAGCYGHNGADDVAFDAAWLARALPGRPVRVLWSRADELSHAPFGPAMSIALHAGVDGQGRIVRWEHEVWSPGHSRRPGRAATPALLGAWQWSAAQAVPPSVDVAPAAGGGAERNAVPGYDFAQLRVRCHTVQTQRRSSALRALGAFANVFAAESFVDEIAAALAADPLALRLSHLAGDARARAVLLAAAQRAGWRTRPRAEGVGQGLAIARYKNVGAWCAVVAEVAAGVRLQVTRLTIAVDVGLAVNPDGVASQIEGGAIQATSWTLKESAAPSHAGWSEYPILTFSEVPAVEVIVMPSTEPSLGAGEASLGPTAAAIANALSDALGVRVRELPLTPDRIVAAMENPPR